MAARRTEGLVKRMVAGADMAEYKLVKFGANDDQAILCDDDDEVIVGVTLMSAKNGEWVDVQMSGIAEVEYGGAVTRGAHLTSDANGDVIVTTTATANTIGFATVAGADGDLGAVFINRVVV